VCDDLRLGVEAGHLDLGAGRLLDRRDAALGDGAQLVAPLLDRILAGPIPGWQTATLPTPDICIGEYDLCRGLLHAHGRYADDYFGLTKSRVRGYLRIPANSTAGGNGVYYYDLDFPRYEWKASNYYVDVLFTPAPQPPVLSLLFEPRNPSIPKTARRGTTAATIIARWSDGTPFTGTLAFGRLIGMTEAYLRSSATNSSSTPKDRASPPPGERSMSPSLPPNEEIIKIVIPRCTLWVARAACHGRGFWSYSGGGRHVKQLKVA
jgi:hypothetical protein